MFYAQKALLYLPGIYIWYITLFLMQILREKIIVKMNNRQKTTQIGAILSKGLTARVEISKLRLIPAPKCNPKNISYPGQVLQVHFIIIL